MEQHVIYKFTSPTGKVYIGRTKDFTQRLIDHLHHANTGNGRPLYKAIRKHGWDNMIKEIIDTSDNLDQAMYKELKYITEYDSVKKGYNCTYNTSGSGDVWEGTKDTDKFKDFVNKMKKINTGSGNGMYGKSHKESTKTLQKQRAKGRFSLPWFISKYGEKEGTSKYNTRRQFLKSRNLPRGTDNKFIKKSS